MNQHNYYEIIIKNELFLSCCLCGEPAVRKCLGILDDISIEKIIADLKKSSTKGWSDILIEHNFFGEKKIMILLDKLKVTIQYAWQI